MTQTGEKVSPNISSLTAEDMPTYSEVQMPTLRSDRPALVVSSTSWTPDEDFSILLDALQIYDNQAQDLANKKQSKINELGGHLPKILVILTGKGPLKEKYMKEVDELHKSWKWVRCISLWLEAEDYPILLGLYRYCIQLLV